MKFKKFLPAAVSLACVLLAFLLLLPRLPARSPQSTDQAFADYTHKLFCEQITSSTLTLHYTLADPKALDVAEKPAIFDSYSREAAKAEAVALENCLEAISSFPSRKLSKENRQTRAVLKTQLSLELEVASFPLYEEILSPTLGTQTQLPILLAEYAFRDRQDVEDYLSLLNQLDAYYESLLRYEQEKSAAGLFMSKRTTDAVIAQCQNFISHPADHFLLSTFEERISRAGFLSQEERAAFLDANRTAVFGHVFPAYELLIKGLIDLKDTGVNDWGLCYFPKGKSYYTALAAYTTGSGRSIAQMKELIEKKILRDVQIMSDMVSAHPELLKAATRTDSDLDPLHLLETLEQKSRQDFPEIRAASYEIKYVDPSLAEYLSPAFYLTPPLDLMENHVIYINPAGQYSDLSLFTTLAHEGYPGHLYQTAWEGAQNLNPVRSLFYFGGYVEGWATYAERYAYDYTSLDPDLARLLAANSAVSLGLYARADIGLHYDGWTLKETAAYLKDYGITDLKTIDAICQAILQDPANYLKYYLGSAEFEELKVQAETALGKRFSLREFHNFLLSFGPAPFPVLQSYLEIWIEDGKQ